MTSHQDATAPVVAGQGGNGKTGYSESTLETRYRQALRSLPAPGTGCHAALLGCANLGVMAGLSDIEIASDIERSVPSGARRVGQREIGDAIRKARQERGNGILTHSTYRPPPAPRRPAFDGPAMRAALIRKGGGSIDPDDPDLWESSPLRLDQAVGHDSIRLLTVLWHPDEYLYIGNGREAGDQQRRHVRTASSWCEFFRRCVEKADAMPDPERSRAYATLGDLYPHIAPNPVTGATGQTKSGTPSYRADACVSRHVYAVAEFDGIPKAEQIAFWRGMGVQIAALIDSGGKSIHAWVVVNARDAGEWEKQVENKLFAEVLVPMGVDSACKNEARLSRLPGVVRPEKGTWQRLLWLAGPNGGRV